MQEYAEAIRRCDAAFEIDNTNNKIVLRRAKACSLNGDYEEAQEVCEALLPIADEALKPSILELLDLNKQRQRAAIKRQREQFGKF
jgi:tetratricopeptide (TPR) repeat protein